MRTAPFLRTTVPVWTSEAATLLSLLLLLGIVVGVPTVKIYRDATEREDPNTRTWTGAMLTLAVVAPVVGPFVLWVVYAAVVGAE